MHCSVVQKPHYNKVFYVFVFDFFNNLVHLLHNNFFIIADFYLCNAVITIKPLRVFCRIHKRFKIVFFYPCHAFASNKVCGEKTPSVKLIKKILKISYNKHRPLKCSKIILHAVHRHLEVAF